MSEWTALAVRPCEPWCVDGKGHEDEHPDDRRCWSTSADVDTTLRPPVQVADGLWVLDRLEVMLCREVGDSAPRVRLYDESSPVGGIDLTPDEARRLRDALSEHLGLAEQSEEPQQ